MEDFLVQPEAFVRTFGSTVGGTIVFHMEYYNNNSDTGELSVDLSDEELKNRKKDWKPREYEYGLEKFGSIHN